MCSTVASSSFRRSCSCLRAENTFMALAGSAIICSIVVGVAYIPCLRIEGITSCVTQRLKDLASRLREPSTSVYNPGSLTKARLEMPLAAPSFEMIVVNFSSSSKRVSACDGLPTSKALHTSAATNHGSPSFIMALTCPNWLLLNICNSFVMLLPFFSVVLATLSK